MNRWTCKTEEETSAAGREIARALPHNAIVHLVGDLGSGKTFLARAIAAEHHIYVVLKGHRTLIATPDEKVFINPTGNPGMATGGMGDVLGGIMAAFLARDIDPFDAACAAVYLHGFAGDLLKEEMGDIGLAAMDLAERIPMAIKRLREG